MCGAYILKGDLNEVVLKGILVQTLAPEYMCRPARDLMYGG